MAFNWKALASKLVTIGAIAFLVTMSVLYLHPIVIDSRVQDGKCMITYISYSNVLCGRTGLYYRTPTLSGTFYYEDENNTTESFGSLVLNRDFPRDDDDLNEITYYFYDDGSDDLLVPEFNCSTATIISTRDLLLRHFNQFIPTMDLASIVDIPSYYPDYRFSCSVYVYYTHHSTYRAYVLYERVNKIYLIPWFAAFGSVLFGLYLITKFDVDGPIKEFAQFILSIVFMAFYLIHIGFYILIFVIIGQVILSIEPKYSDEQFWKKGSIFFPFFMVFRCVRRKCNDCRSASPEAEAAPPPAPSAAHAGRASTRRRSISISSSSRSASPDKPPSYPTVDIHSTVVPNLTIVGPPDDMMMSAPPPSYDDVVRGDNLYSDSRI